MRRILSILAASLVAIASLSNGATSASDSTTSEGRAVWVTRWQYKTPDDIRKIMENCAAMRMNVIMLQVRGEGTAFYKSAIEPWAWELTSTSPLTTGKDPGWDPLKVAIDEAHKRGLHLHAWMNVFPGWRGQKYPPPEAKQLWTKHPDWFMVDKKGNKMIPRDHDVDPSVGTWYSFLNPAHPEVQEYVPKVFLEVVKNYDVDGIHYDYVRYPGEIDDFSYDPVSLKRFKDEVGGTPDEKPQEWIEWRGKQVTGIVRRIYEETTKLKPYVVVGGSVIANFERAKDRYFARSQEWLKEPILDLATPMNYTSGEVFERQTLDFVKNSGAGHVYIGMSAGSPRRTPRRAAGSTTETTPDTAISTATDRAGEAPQLHQQIKFCRKVGATGVCIFSYGPFANRDGSLSEYGKALADGPFKTPAKVPPMPWKKQRR